MDKLLVRLKQSYPDVQFRPGAHFSWSPRYRRILYQPQTSSTLDAMRLLHEVAHAQLNHQAYQSDLELLLMEVAAWRETIQLSTTYTVAIDETHIQACLDSYRNWAYRRSLCPVCATSGIQQATSAYHCYNCSYVWRVSSSRFCRTYRSSGPPQQTPGS